MTDDDKALVERLRALQATLAQMTDSEFAVACSGEFCEDFKNTIEGCIANSLDRIEQLEAALRPFIDAIGRIDLSREYGENRVEFHWGKGRATAVTVASFTQALAALKETKHD